MCDVSHGLHDEDAELDVHEEPGRVGALEKRYLELGRARVDGEDEPVIGCGCRGHRSCHR